MFWLKRNRKNNRLQRTLLYFLGLLLAISTALPAYIQSNFLNEFVSLKMVSLFFIIANLLTVFTILLFPQLIKKLTNYFLAKTVLVIYMASLLGLALSTNTAMAFCSIILFIISSNLIWINMDVMLESFSTNAQTGRIRTTYFTFMNLGWILAPNLSAYLINLGNYTLPFLVAAGLVVPFLIIFLYAGRHLKDRVRYKKETILKSFKRMWKNKNLRGIFFIALLLQIFYSSAVVYIPIYLHQNLGISWNTLGLMFSIMLLPFVIFEIPAGIIADKYIGEKEILYLGIFILIASLFLFFYIKTPIIWLWTLTLFLSRVGASLIEAMRETYFFKLVDVKNLSFINFFRTTSPLGYVIGPALVILIINFLPLQYIFLILAIIMLTGFFFIASIKDTK